MGDPFNLNIIIVQRRVNIFLLKNRWVKNHPPVLKGIDGDTSMDDSIVGDISSGDLFADTSIQNGSMKSMYAVSIGDDVFAADLIVDGLTAGDFMVIPLVTLQAVMRIFDQKICVD